MESKMGNDKENIAELEKEEDKEQLGQEQIGQLQPGQEPVQEEYKNAKEKLYDHIPITIKVLDIIITVAITALALILLYLVINSNAF